jgi:thioredoxin-like negative regulator of GroEL
VAWVQVTEKRRLRVVEVDAEEHPDLARELGVTDVPALVLLRGSEVLGRLDGRATGTAIARLIDTHVA